MVQVRACAERLKKEEIPLQDVNDDRSFRSRPLGSRTTAPPGPIYDELRHDSNQDSLFLKLLRGEDSRDSCWGAAHLDGTGPGFFQEMGSAPGRGLGQPAGGEGSDRWKGGREARGLWLSLSAHKSG